MKRKHRASAVKSSSSNRKKRTPARKPSETRRASAKANRPAPKGAPARVAKKNANHKPRSVTSEFEEMLASAALTPQQYVLRLYVTGSTPRSSRAIQNIRLLCDHHLAGRYDLEIIDIYQQPTLASGDQIIAAPTLIRKVPTPLRKVIGDLSDEQQVLIGLDLSPREKQDNQASPDSDGGSRT